MLARARRGSAGQLTGSAVPRGVARPMISKVVGMPEHTVSARPGFATRAALVDGYQDGKCASAGDTIIGVLNVKSGDKTLNGKQGTLIDADTAGGRC